jgi:hypothetical protein
MGYKDVKSDANAATVSLEEHPNNALDVAIGRIRSSMIKNLSSASHVLTVVARHYAERPSKFLRPLLIILMGCATNKDSFVSGKGVSIPLILWQRK